MIIRVIKTKKQKKNNMIPNKQKNKNPKIVKKKIMKFLMMRIKKR